MKKHAGPWNPPMCGHRIKATGYIVLDCPERGEMTTYCDRCYRRQRAMERRRNR